MTRKTLRVNDEIVVEGLTMKLWARTPAYLTPTQHVNSWWVRYDDRWLLVAQRRTDKTSWSAYDVTALVHDVRVRADALGTGMLTIDDPRRHEGCMNGSVAVHKTLTTQITRHLVAEHQVVYQEAYGLIYQRIWGLYRKHQISPSDHQMIMSSLLTKTEIESHIMANIGPTGLYIYPAYLGAGHH